MQSLQHPIYKALLQTLRSQLATCEQSVTARPSLMVVSQNHVLQMRERLGKTAPISVPSSPRQPAQPAVTQDAAAPATPPQVEQVLMGASPQDSPLLYMPAPELDFSYKPLVGAEDSSAASDASDTASDVDSDTIAEGYHDFALDEHAAAPAVAPVPPVPAATDPTRTGSSPAPAAGLVQGAIPQPLGISGGAPPAQDLAPHAPRNGGVGALHARPCAALGAVLLLVEACGFADEVVRGRSIFHARMPSSPCKCISKAFGHLLCQSALPTSCALSLAAN